LPGFYEIVKLSNYCRGGSRTAPVDRVSFFYSVFFRVLKDSGRQLSGCSHPSKGRVVYLPQVIPPDSEEAAAWKGSWDAKWILPANSREITAAVRRAAGGGFSLELEAPDRVAVEQMEKEGMVLVHLVNFKKGNVLSGLSLNVALTPGTGVRSVRLLSPEIEAEKELPFEVEAGRCHITVPRLVVYDVIVLKEGKL